MNQNLNLAFGLSFRREWISSHILSLQNISFHGIFWKNSHQLCILMESSILLEVTTLLKTVLQKAVGWWQWLMLNFCHGNFYFTETSRLQSDVSILCRSNEQWYIWGEIQSASFILSSFQLGWIKHKVGSKLHQRSRVSKFITPLEC